KVIQEQNALSLRQVLSNVSGITFNAGEGGGGSGDSINIRGFSGRLVGKGDGSLRRSMKYSILVIENHWHLIDGGFFPQAGQLR
ncbi:TonB-dependent receptor plug domain-containing protein, partial [Pseudomonas aeruginosa]|uniref:TonB-dependent receptor plug domain-containing protein n=1 Tax=Pseudomonas aeruginosa TaxID=287 RepID=UPI0021AB79B5